MGQPARACVIVAIWPVNAGKNHINFPAVDGLDWYDWPRYLWGEW